MSKLSVIGKNVVSSVRSAVVNYALKDMSWLDFSERFIRGADSVTDNNSGVNLTTPYQQSVWVYAAVNLISKTVARTPVIVTDSSGKKVSSGPLVDFIASMDRNVSLPDLIEQFFIELLRRGTVLPLVKYNGLAPKWIDIGTIDQFRPDIRFDSDNEEFAPRWIRNSSGVPQTVGDGIFEVKLYNPYNNILGLSPLNAAFLSIYGDLGANVYNKAFFDKGAQPGIVFTTNDDRFGPDQAKEALKLWNEAHQGAVRGHGSAFLGNGLKPAFTSFTPAEMAFGDLKMWSKSEINAVYNIPNGLIGGEQSQSGIDMSGKNQSTPMEDFIFNTAMPWAGVFARFFNSNISWRFGTKIIAFDYDSLPIMQDRQLERAKEGREWLKGGATFNEVTEQFGMGFGPHEWGNDAWFPSNMLPARLLMDGPPNAVPPEKIQDSADAKDAKE